MSEKKFVPLNNTARLFAEGLRNYCISKRGCDGCVFCNKLDNGSVKCCLQERPYKWEVGYGSDKRQT